MKSNDATPLRPNRDRLYTLYVRYMREAGRGIEELFQSDLKALAHFDQIHHIKSRHEFEASIDKLSEEEIIDLEKMLAQPRPKFPDERGGGFAR